MGSEAFVHLLASANNAAAGVQKNLSAMTQLGLAGNVYTPTTLVTYLQNYGGLVTSLIAAHAQVHALVLQERAQRKQLLAVLQGLYAVVANLYGSDPSKLGDFGFAPHKKRGVESAATRAEAASKASATRARKKAALAAAEATPGAPAPAAAGTVNGTAVVKP